MVNSKLLIQIINYNHATLSELSDVMRIDRNTLHNKLKSGILQTNEVEMLLHYLKFPVDPLSVFFDSYDFETGDFIEWE